MAIAVRERERERAHLSVRLATVAQERRLERSLDVHTQRFRVNGNRALILSRTVRSVALGLEGACLAQCMQRYGRTLEPRARYLRACAQGTCLAEHLKAKELRLSLVWPAPAREQAG